MILLIIQFVISDERDWISHLLNEPLKSDEFKQTVSDRFCNLLNSEISSLERFNDMKELRRQIISWKTTKVCKRMSEFIDQILAGTISYLLIFLKYISK